MSKIKNLIIFYCLPSILFLTFVSGIYLYASKHVNIRKLEKTHNSYQSALLYHVLEARRYNTLCNHFIEDEEKYLQYNDSMTSHIDKAFWLQMKKDSLYALIKKQ